MHARLDCTYLHVSDCFHAALSGASGLGRELCGVLRARAMQLLHKAHEVPVVEKLLVMLRISRVVVVTVANKSWVEL